MPCDVLVVEEITMMDVQLWADVCKLRLSQKVSCILSGDFAQSPAILEHWCGTTFAEGKLEESHMVRDLAGSNRLTLSVNRRNDEVLLGCPPVLAELIELNELPIRNLCYLEI